MTLKFTKVLTLKCQTKIEKRDNRDLVTLLEAMENTSHLLVFHIIMEQINFQIMRWFQTQEFQLDNHKTELNPAMEFLLITTETSLNRQ